jgi:iron complex outermembrane recepter protein
MNRVWIFILVVFRLSALGQDPGKKAGDSALLLEPVELRAIRAGENSPFTKSTIYRKEIEKNNLGTDLPFLLNQTPSVVINSDAGNGIGYTGIRIRGTDASRINVTLNGIPFNDSESQGTFFVDLPDFASSVSSIQVQRGVGTSSNGTGAFGASINISTNEVITKPYAELNTSFGSFNTGKITAKAGSGLLNNHFTIDLRLSGIQSEGYIDRASSNLKSFYFSTAWLAKKTSLRLNIFSGKEKTYQAWYGVSATDLAKNRNINYAGTEKPGDPYDNEIDNYRQDHFQLFFNHQFHPRLKFHAAAFYVHGKGFYEQYKADEAYADYGLPEPPTGTQPVTHSDMIRQLWLDNDFYGNNFSLQYRDSISEFTLGTNWSQYGGNHFGKVTWADKGLLSNGNWYDLDAVKDEASIYFKELTKIKNKFSLFYDLQYRRVKYKINGFRNNPSLQVSNTYNFWNPKAGISYSGKTGTFYFSYSKGQKEPNRDDFEANREQAPQPEKLNDFETGFEIKNPVFSLEITGFYMRYKNQLVLTGKINDVGAYTRTNIPKSYRLGLEISGTLKLSSSLNAAANFSLSRNKVLDFTEYIDDYDNGGQQTNTYSLSDLAFSPNRIGGAVINYIPVKNTEISLMSKYVSCQYLDNTQQAGRKLDAYFTQDIRTSWTLQKRLPKEIKLILQANNVFNSKYEPNGYTFSYIYGGSLTTENYYFPMAGINFMLGLNIKF